MKIHHLAIKVEDPERSLSLYRDLLGLPELRRWFEPEGRLRSVWLELEAGAFVALERAESSGLRADEAPGHHCLALAIAAADRDAWRTKLSLGGIGVERESPYSLYFRDRDQNLIALSHHPDAEL